MAAYQLALHFTLRDVDGAQSTVTVHVGAFPDTATVANVKSTSDAFNTPLGPLSNAKVVQRSASILIDEAQGVGTDAEFPLISQKATIHFSNALGGRASLAIPAPVEAIFHSPPSDDIVDPTNALMAAFITAFEASAKDVAGNPLNLFQGGALSSRRRTRRRSIHS